MSIVLRWIFRAGALKELCEGGMGIVWRWVRDALRTREKGTG